MKPQGDVKHGCDEADVKHGCMTPQGDARVSCTLCMPCAGSGLVALHAGPGAGGGARHCKLA